VLTAERLLLPRVDAAATSASRCQFLAATKRRIELV
jgi:hypothetical protein